MRSEFGGDPAVGTFAPVTDPSLSISDSKIANQTTPQLSGGGGRFSFRAHGGNSWFAGFDYTGFFVDEKISRGSTTDDTDDIHANLLDGSMSDAAALNGDFDEGIVDFGSDDISLDQHFLDFVLGRQSEPIDGLSAFWQAGVRVTKTDVDREVFYQNQEGFPPLDVDTAHITLNSEMWGAGPTLGGGLEAKLFGGLVLSGRSSVSALYANFDLSRHDTYINSSLVPRGE